MGRARYILVVDDDADFRSALRCLLEDEGCSVYEAADGKAALDVLRTVVPDLIFLDLIMPGMDGWEFCETLRKTPALAEIPIVLLSGTDAAGPEGFSYVLHKPVNLPTLLGLLQAIDEPASVPHLQ